MKQVPYKEKSADTTNEAKLDFQKVFPVFLVVLVDLLGLTVIIPLLPLYAASFGADAAVIGLIGAAYPLAQFLGAPFLGRMSDKFGRKPILLISQVGTFIGFVLLALANSLPMILISRLLDGLSGANISTAQAIITDSTTEKNRTAGLGLIGAAFGLGFVLGPVITGITLALSGNNYQLPPVIAALFSLASILLTYFKLEETHSAEKRTQAVQRSPFSFGAMIKALRHPGIGVLLLLIFTQQIAFGGFEHILGLFTLNRLGLNAAGNSILFVFVGVILVFVQGYYIGKWSRRFGDRKLVYGGLVLLSLGLTLIAFTPHQPPPWYNRADLQAELTRQVQQGRSTNEVTSIAIPPEGDKGLGGLAWLLLTMIPLSIGGGILQPSINSLITKRVQSEERGGILGISTSFLSLANIFAPLIGGFLFQGYGASTPMVVWALLLVGVLILAVALLGSESQSKPTAVPS